MRIDLSSSGLPIGMDSDTHRLCFADGLTCAGGGSRNAGDMKPLLFRPDGLDEGETVYSFYRGISFPRDRELLRKFHLRYDITVVEPGTLNGERKKTSGHYHGMIEGSPFTFPEIYEVLHGSALFILQKAERPETEADPVIQDLKAVFVRPGQAIVIPPFYGHCSVNAGGTPLVFSNIAAADCPLFYEPIVCRHGLALYALNRAGGTALVPNPHYGHSRAATTVTPREDPSMGIRFGYPIYRALIDSPETFSYLLKPDKTVDRMDAMLVPDHS